VASTILVDQDVAAGQALVDALDRNGFPLNGALWYRLADPDQWRLLLISPLVDEVGPQAGYERLHTTMQGNSGTASARLKLDDITLVSPNDDLVKVLPPYRALQGTPSPSAGGPGRLGPVIQDAYVYRFEPPRGVKLRSPWPATLEDVIKQAVRNALQKRLGDGYRTSVRWSVDVQQVPNVPITLQRVDDGKSATATVNPLLPEVLLGDSLGPLVEDTVERLARRLRLY
jgi:hypothetical protein